MPRPTHYRIVVEEESGGRVVRTFEHMPASFVDAAVKWLDDHAELAARVARTRSAWQQLVADIGELTRPRPKPARIRGRR